MSYRRIPISIPSYMFYWGKAKKDPLISGPDYHLFVFHSLDVAAVADVWWQKSPAIRNSFVNMFGMEECQVRAWVLFFIALHDYGKMDVRFQAKAPEVWAKINPELSALGLSLTNKKNTDYFHGPAGLYWLFQDFSDRFQVDVFGDDNNNDDWSAWSSWIAAVAGHHGGIPDLSEEDYRFPSLYNKKIKEKIQYDRQAYVYLLEDLFLVPAGISVRDNPPSISKLNLGMAYQAHEYTMLAGFCSVCDWLGSTDYFPYDDKPLSSVLEIKAWFESRHINAADVLKDAGVISRINKNPDISLLLDGNKPRGVQCLLGEISKKKSLTLVEAATGEGKTEMALVLAWELLALGLADCIIFALPTQATANAMLKRLELAAPIIFEDKPHLVLAHGRAQYQQDFIKLKDACKAQTMQGDEEALVECGEWLAQSRKRVFLGQVGVCTIDQTLVSVLPVKHKFIRGFGLGRSVLIVDEVHAYSSYMYGLLAGVLQQQRLAGGSAILLSATLPFFQKQQLAKAWGCELSDANSNYPLVTQCMDGQAKPFWLSAPSEDLPEIDSGKNKSNIVNIEVIASDDILPDDILVERVLAAVEGGAQVAFVCNLVDVAQNFYRVILEEITKSKKISLSQILLLHSRYLYEDRQIKERRVCDLFGRKPKPENSRSIGHLLIGTQVLENSLDLNMDWMIVQLCPVDSLFQRWGRLHRHDTLRPLGFEDKKCTILVPNTLDYKLHALIYGNSRVLWRTHQLLLKALSEEGGEICFPKAYREWIESVYDEDVGAGEPEEVTASFDRYWEECSGAIYTAKQLMRKRFSLDDVDSNVSALTRDGEMGLNVVLFYLDSAGKQCFLSGDRVDALDKSKFYEQISLNSVSVPATWGSGKNKTALPQPDVDGVIWLELEVDGGVFFGTCGGYKYTYSSAVGFSRKERRPKPP